MAKVTDFFRFSINLQSSPQTAEKFSIPMIMVDTDDVPVDTRYRQVTPSTYATRLTADSEAYNWYEQFYAAPQAVDPPGNTLGGYVGRWVSAAIAAYRIFQDAEDDYSVWVAAAALGAFNIDDGTNDEDISPDFTGDTDMDDVAASITAAFVASTNFTGYTCTVDALDRLNINGSATGASAPSFTIDSPAAGTDLSGATYLANSTSFLQAGLDAESIGAAANAVFALDDTPSILFERGGNATQKLAFLSAMDLLEKFTVITDDDTDAEDSETTTTIGYQAKALELDQCHIIYTRHDDYGDAAAYGEVLPQDEGSVDLALTPFNGISVSGLAADGVTAQQIDEAGEEALEGFGYDWFVKPLTYTHLSKGLTPNGDEARIVLCKLWAQYNVSREGYLYLIANKVTTFSDLDVQAIKGIIEKYMDECVVRRCIDAGYVLTMPSAADFTAAQKASHTMSLTDLADCAIQFAVNNVFASLTWSAQ